LYLSGILTYPHGTPNAAAACPGYGVQAGIVFAPTQHGKQRHYKGFFVSNRLGIGYFYPYPKGLQAALYALHQKTIESTTAGYQQPSFGAGR
jgi:hypothetical protein